MIQTNTKLKPSFDYLKSFYYYLSYFKSKVFDYPII